jgi:hypothetical protein
MTPGQAWHDLNVPLRGVDLVAIMKEITEEAPPPSG